MSTGSSVKVDVLVRAGIALLLIWATAGGAVAILHSRRPHAESVIGFLRQQELARLESDDRERIIREAAERLNSLSFDEMRAVRQSRAFFTFYRPLRPSEKERFAELIVPTGLRRIVEASRALPRVERAGFLENALYLAVIDLSTPNPQIDPVALERIQRDALNGYLQSLTPAEQSLMQPQMEQIRGYLRPAR
jgi:hypothetical protein